MPMYGPLGFGFEACLNRDYIDFLINPDGFSINEIRKSM